MHVYVVQEELPARMGKALRGLSTVRAVDNKVYPTWDALVDRLLHYCSFLCALLTCSIISGSFLAISLFAMQENVL